MICWKLTKILAPQIREILQTFVNFRIFAVLCLRLFKTYHFQTWQVYPLKTLLTKQKIRQKQLAFFPLFQTAKPSFFGDQTFLWWGTGLFPPTPNNNHQPPSPRPNLLLPPPPPPLWTTIAKQKTRLKQLAFSRYFEQPNRRYSDI